MACNTLSGGDCGVNGIRPALFISWRRGGLIENASGTHNTSHYFCRAVFVFDGELPAGLDRAARRSLIRPRYLPLKHKGGIKAAFSLGKTVRRLEHVHDDE